MPRSGTSAGSSFDFRPDPFVIAYLPLDASDDDAIVWRAAQDEEIAEPIMLRSVEQPTAPARQILVSGSFSSIADRAISTAFAPRNLRKSMWIQLACGSQKRRRC
jgi:hypothetical protein